MDKVNSGLKLIKYRDPESIGFLYFWTENQEGIDVHVSPMFNTEDDAKIWLKELIEKVNHACRNRTL